MQVRNSPLLVEDRLVVEKNKVSRGSLIRREITVKNLSEQDDLTVDAWVETTDARSEVLLGWYRFDPEPPLKIKRGQPATIALNFEVPPQANPAIYNYALVFEAAQYPKKDVRRLHQLQVLLSEQDMERDTEPNVTIDPVTTSTKPAHLAPGETLSVNLTIENRSKRTDLFYLSCPELAPEWFTVIYPERGGDRLGVVQESEGLPLNPKTSGEIKLLIHPPALTPAGTYFPTIQLISKNKEKKDQEENGSSGTEGLVLLDVIYLKVSPDERLAAQLIPTRCIIPEQSGEFQLELANLGNIHRTVLLQAEDAEHLFNYNLALDRIELKPGETQQIDLWIKPRKWWRRPWRGNGLEFQFDVSLANPETAQLLALPSQLPQGIILWKAQPWWKRWLPILLLALLLLAGIGTLAFFIWFNLSKPKFLPRIVEVRASKQVYGEGVLDPIRFDWRISHADKIDKVVVIRSEKGIETGSLVYLFEGKIPSNLENSNQQKPNNYCEKTREKVKVDASDRDKTLAFLSGLIPLVNHPIPQMRKPKKLKFPIYPAKVSPCKTWKSPFRKQVITPLRCRFFLKLDKRPQPTRS